MQCVAVDVGTSFTKAAIVHPDTGAISHQRRVPAVRKRASDNPLFAEYDADLIVDQVRGLINELVRECGGCDAILLSGQMGGLVLTDSAGAAIGPYISWLDKRLTSLDFSGRSTWFDRLASVVGDHATDTLGNEFRPGLPLAFLYWLKQNGCLPSAGRTTPCTLPDYVAARLCHVVPVMEWTCSCGLLDVQRRSFAEDVIAELGLSQLHWPQIVDFRHQVGLFHAKDGTSRIPVYAAVGDHQCSLAGTFLAEQELSVNVSTGSQISLLTRENQPGDFQLRPSFDGQYLRTITNIPAGRALSALMKLLGEMASPNSEVTPAENWDYFFDQAEQVSETDLGVQLGFFPSAIPGPGGLYQMHEGNMTVGHVARAALEQMADYYHQLSDRLGGRAAWNCGVLSGGVATRSTLLQRLISDRLQTPFRLAAAGTEETLTGLLLLGRVIAGLSATVAEAQADVSCRR